MFDKYEVQLTLTRDMLGTNPCDPNVLDKHIVQKQRSLILEKSKVNKAINKYLDAIDISEEKSDEEINKLLDKLENATGVQLTDQERKDAMAGDLSKLKETFKEMDTTGTTVFFWDKDKDLPCIGDHMIYGFLKAAAEAIGRTLPKKNATMLNSISYTQNIINQHVKCEEQFITFDRDIKRDEEGRAVYNQRSLRAMTAQGPRISLAKSEVIPAGSKIKFTLKVLKNSPMTRDTLISLLEYGQLSGLGQWRNAGYGQFVAEVM